MQCWDPTEGCPDVSASETARDFQKRKRKTEGKYNLLERGMRKTNVRATIKHIMNVSLFMKNISRAKSSRIFMPFILFALRKVENIDDNKLYNFVLAVVFK